MKKVTDRTVRQESNQFNYCIPVRLDEYKTSYLHPTLGMVMFEQNIALEEYGTLHFDFDIYKKGNKFFHFRKIHENKIIEIVKSVPGIEYVSGVDCRYEMTLRRGLLFNWHDIVPSVLEAISNTFEQKV